MPTAIAPRLMTADEFLALPEDGMDRWLIRGELKEKPEAYRDRHSAAVLAELSYRLLNWLERQPFPRGSAFAGNVGIWFSRTPDSVIGVDLTYLSVSGMKLLTDRTDLIDSVPTLIVEVLSPSDTIDEINEKIDVYLDAGVPLIWVIDPHRKTVEICRPGQEPTLANLNDRLSAEPHLPGFDVAVAEIFA